MNELFGNHKAIVGMIHVAALPGTPRSTMSIGEIVDVAMREAETYTEHGLDGLLIENMHDVPYLAGTVGPEIVAGMTAVAAAIKRVAALPLGVQILAAANREALAVAQASGAEFVRVENFAYAHVADEGLLPEAEAGPLLRYRRQIGAERIRVIADVKKKHSSHAITADVSLAEAAKTGEFFGADGIIVTGIATGQPALIEDVETVRRAVDVPVWIGSGVTPDHLRRLWPHADVYIVGSHFKQAGVWSNPIDTERVTELMQAVGELRSS